MWYIVKCTDSRGAVIHPERFLHVGTQQNFPVTDGASVEVHLYSDGSALIEVPVKVVWTDLNTTCNHNKGRISLGIIWRRHITFLIQENNEVTTFEWNGVFIFSYCQQLGTRDS